MLWYSINDRFYNNGGFFFVHGSPQALPDFNYALLVGAAFNLPEFDKNYYNNRNENTWPGSIHHCKNARIDRGDHIYYWLCNFKQTFQIYKELK